MLATSKVLHYRVKGGLEVCKDCAVEKTIRKSLHKVEEERNLNPGKMIYLDLISQRKPSYGGSKNCILIQDSVIEQKTVFIHKGKSKIY